MSKNGALSPFRALFCAVYFGAIRAVLFFGRASILVKKHLFGRPPSDKSARRLGIQSPLFEQKLKDFSALDGSTVWIHAVSLGEAKAALGLINLLALHFPKAKFALSTSTETGFAEMSRISAGAKTLALYLPIDEMHLMRSLIDQISPKLALFVEGDIWLNFLKVLAQKKAFTAVVSAKISTRSFNRLRPFKAILSLYWDHLDLICTQSENTKAQLQQLNAPVDRLITTGNLKLSNELPSVDQDFFKALMHQIGSDQDASFIVLASTHPGEEQLLIKALVPLLRKYSHLHLIIVPRHPARCTALAKALGLEFGSATTHSKGSFRPSNPSARLHLIEQSGHLTDCYRVAKLAIVGGSFIKGTGGHNIFEPMLVPTPPFFGPHMENQSELVALAVEFRAGQQSTPIELCHRIDEILSDESKLLALHSGCKQAVASARGSLKATWRALERRGAFLPFHCDQ